MKFEIIHILWLFIFFEILYFSILFFPCVTAIKLLALINFESFKTLRMALFKLKFKLLLSVKVYFFKKPQWTQFCNK